MKNRNSKDYFARKNVELELLASCAKKPCPKVPARFAEIINAKLHMKWALREKALVYQPGLSNISRNRERRYFDYRVRYGYSRSQFLVVSPDPVPMIYPELRSWPQNRRSSMFTGSGQAAMAGTLLTMQRSLGDLQVISATPKMYFETQDYLSDYALERSGKTKVALLDLSHAQAVPQLPKAPWIVFDTTCIDVSGGWIRQIVGQARKKKHVRGIFLIRSHPKMESLGVEYHSLGSVVALFRSAKDNAAMAPLIHRTLRLTGGLAPCENLYPFFPIRRFQSLNSLRNRYVENFTAAVSDSLGERFPSIHQETFLHNRFFWMPVPRRVSKREVERRVNKLVSLLGLFGLPAALTESFGWDFVAISVLPVGVERWAIRLSLGDFPVEMAEDVAATVYAALHPLFEVKR